MGEKPLRVVFVGNVIPRKGVDTLITALSRLDEPWSLTIVGGLSADPNYVSDLEEQVDELGLGDRVRFTGRITDPELDSVLRRSHVFAMPSTYEGFGITYLEAMGFGLPVIATSEGGASGLVRHGENGFLVSPNEPDTIRTILESLAEDREYLARRGLCARESYLDHETWTRTGELVHSFLHEQF